MEIRDEIIGMIDKMKYVSIPVQEKSNLYADIGLDSLSFITLLLAIEERYAITFELLEMEKCLQVDRLIALVRNKLAAAEHDSEFIDK